MKLSVVQTAVSSALAILLSAPACEASASHDRLHLLHKKAHDMHHRHSHEREDVFFSKRGGQCQFPTNDPNLVAVTPDEENAGWAMSPNQACKPNMYCPIACKPGMVMAQWDPDATSYTYPQSMNGGLFCDSNGEIQKPFPNSPNCVPGTGSVTAVNKCSGGVAWCQTVLPGNEAMLIPTLVESTATIAVPGPSYWCSTAAHFYVNPPGNGIEVCAWGTASNPTGNWSPYVAGANTDSSGNTYVKIAWNPIWINSGLKDTPPTFGIEVTCSDGSCNNAPCKIDPSKGDIGTVISADTASGAGGADFCVVTVPSGGSAEIVTFEIGGGSSSSDGSSENAMEGPSSSSSPPPPSSTSSSSSSSSSSSPPPPTTSSSTAAPTTTSSTQASTTQSSSSSTKTPDFFPGVFHENATAASTSFTKASTTVIPNSAQSQTQDAATPSHTKKGEAGRQQGSAALAGLVVAFIATAYFF